MRWAIGLDVGGTKVAGGCVSEAGEIREFRSQLLPGRGSDALEAVLRMAHELIAAQRARGLELQGLGIGVPGAVDLPQRLVQRAPNLDWSDLPLVALAEERLGLPCEIDLDVRATALGEMLFGAGRGVSDFVYVTIGTGIGAGLVIGGKLLYGHHSTSGEIGHCVLEAGGPRCGCGQYGCFEALAAGPAIAARAERARAAALARSLPTELAAGAGRIDARMVFDAARAGDPLACSVLDETSGYLARGLSILVNLVDPQRIILGGGVAEAGEILFTRVRAALPGYILHKAARQVELVPSSRPGAIGVLGAASLVFVRRAS